jgi:hypothetical protein
MKGILTRLFEKKGIKDISELSYADKLEFDKWNGILSEGEVTLDKVLQFCTTQLSLIERQFRDLDISTQKRDRLMLLHGVYSALKEVITQPKAQKEALEKYLEGLLSS